MEYITAIEQNAGIDILKFVFPKIGNGALEKMLEAGRVPPRPGELNYRERPVISGNLMLIPNAYEPVLISRNEGEIRALSFSITPRNIPFGSGQRYYEIYSLDSEIAKEIFNSCQDKKTLEESK